MENGERLIAADRGWLAEFIRGQQIFRQLSAMTPEQQRQRWINEYRGEKVALVGLSAPPGTGDLVGTKGFYLRVVFPKGKEPAPKNIIWCETLLKGTILRVFPANKIIVIEVEDQEIIQSG